MVEFPRFSVALCRAKEKSRGLPLPMVGEQSSWEVFIGRLSSEIYFLGVANDDIDY